MACVCFEDNLTKHFVTMACEGKRRRYCLLTLFFAMHEMPPSPPTLDDPFITAE